MSNHSPTLNEISDRFHIECAEEIARTTAPLHFPIDFQWAREELEEAFFGNPLILDIGCGIGRALDVLGARPRGHVER